MKTIIRQTTFLVMVLLAAVCHGAKTNRYDYSRFNHLTAENITALEHMRTTFYKSAVTNVDTNNMEMCVWNMAKHHDVCNRWSNEITKTSNYTFVKYRKVVEIPKTKNK